MIDHWGIGRSIVLFSIVSIIGLCIYEYSAVTENFTMAIIGRSIFGVGSEAQSIYIATAINIWFRFDGHEYQKTLMKNTTTPKSLRRGASTSTLMTSNE